MLPPNAVWFITGSSSGIGLALTNHALSQNHRVVATARNPKSLSHLEDNPQLLKLALDVTDQTSMDAALDAALAHFGRIDVLVNNAGVNTLGIAELYPLGDLRRAMETNFWGPVYLMRRAVGIFRDVNVSSEGGVGGTVVNVSSIGGRIALPAEAGYHASKFALEGFTESMAAEMDPAWKIRMMILEPGGTKSNFTSTSAATRGPSLPAYDDPELAVNVMIEALTDPGLYDRLVDASEVARCVFETLQREEIPLRLVTGAEAYALVKAKESVKMEELERWRDVSEGVGRADIPTGS